MLLEYGIATIVVTLTLARVRTDRLTQVMLAAVFGVYSALIWTVFPA